jgi:hypothetical protein
MQELLAFFKASFPVGVLSLALFLSPVAFQPQKCPAMEINAAGTRGIPQLIAFDDPAHDRTPLAPECACASWRSLCCGLENKPKASTRSVFLAKSDSLRHLFHLPVGHHDRGGDRTPIREIGCTDSPASYKSKEPFLVNCTFLI